MEKQPDSITAVVLAAGKGTRMKTDRPKVAVTIHGKPMLNYVIDNLVAGGITRIVFVVGYKKEEVMSLVPPLSGINATFVFQEEQKGTAHALLCAERVLTDFHGDVDVASGDMPLIRPETFRTLVREHRTKSNRATVLSATMENPFGYGRLVRDGEGKLTGIVEEKDADDEIRKIREVNTGTYVFDAPEIFEILKKIDTKNKQQEFYLTDAVAIFKNRGDSVGSLLLDDANESLGANSMEDIVRIEKLVKPA